jgi:hypothetical protein
MAANPGEFMQSARQFGIDVIDDPFIDGHGVSSQRAVPSDMGSDSPTGPPTHRPSRQYPER